MLKSLHIKNLGPHKEVHIDFAPITCIVGKSYRGKSWTLRALRLAALNRPSGTRFIRWGSKTASVKVVSDRHSVKRVRGKTINKYVVDEQVLKAFGSNVPRAVEQALNMGPLNFQLQQELPAGEGPLFWFALSPSQVSKRLNQIVDLEVIDRALSNIQRIVRTAQSRVTIGKERLRSAKERSQSLSFVKAMGQKWDEILLAFRKAEKQRVKVASLINLIDTISAEKEKLRERKHVVQQMDADLKAVEAIYAEIAKKQVKIEDLRNLLNAITWQQKEKRRFEYEMFWAQTELKKLMKDRCPLCSQEIKKQ